jgi:hypothetical protein
MTLMLIENTYSEEEQLEQVFNPTVKCSWCGEIIRLDGEELALAMCANCYQRMVAEYEHGLKIHQADSDTQSSDR